MNSSSELRIDWATPEAAKYACEKWHYSKCTPRGKVVRFGVWESGKFIGLVLFGAGACPHIGTPYGLNQTQVCELTRIALTNHKTPVSRIMAIILKKLKSHAKGLRLVISFADSSQGHYGGIYQATNWIYVGGTETHVYYINGKKTHPMTVGKRHGKGGSSITWLRENVDPNARRENSGFKHKYLMPLDEEMKKKIQPLKQPYPKRVGSADSGTVPIHGTRDGANPIPTLHTLEGCSHGS
jgi:hypothetical protein